MEILECLRQNLNKLVKSGTLVPIKEMMRDRLFFLRGYFEEERADEEINSFGYNYKKR
ncbi:hypothetical protein [Bacillus cereus]|uniref:hypothetical protein n=1 Tax=Bacillus cereus TaxID=1396 RepID=UPI00345B5B2C